MELHTLLFLITMFGVLKTIHCQRIQVKIGYHLKDSKPMAALTNSSLKSCHGSCITRERCKSLQFDRRSHLCILNTVDSSTPGTQLIVAPTFVYSEKKNWTQTILQQLCKDKCNINETCSPYDNKTVCLKTECDEPSLNKTIYSRQLGNMRDVGSRIIYVCKYNTSVHVSSVCMENGTWSTPSSECIKHKDLMSVDCGNPPAVPNAHYKFTHPGNTKYGASATFSCDPCFDGNDLMIQCMVNGKWNVSVTSKMCAIKGTVGTAIRKLATNISTSMYMVVNCVNDRYWHFDFGRSVEDSPVTVKWQPNDGYCYFRFEQMPDASYKIKNPSSSMYIGDGDGTSTCGCLNGRAVMDDDHKLFKIYEESPGTYSIISKGTGKYVRVDEDKYVTSKQNKLDGYALFNFKPVP